MKDIIALLGIVALIVSTVDYVGFLVRRRKQAQQPTISTAGQQMRSRPWVAIVALIIFAICVAAFSFLDGKRGTPCRDEDFNPLTKVSQPKYIA